MAVSELGPESDFFEEIGGGAVLLEVVSDG